MSNRKERTDQHTITTDQVDQERDGVRCTGWTAFCSCGWSSRVFTEYEEIAIEAAKKHANWVERPVQRRHLQVHFRVEAKDLTEDALRELIRTTERADR